MLLTAALSLSLFSHPPQWPRLPHLLPVRHADAHSARRTAQVGPWRVVVDTDRFSGAVSCSVTARDVSLGKGALIFRVSDRGDTTQADYRLDWGAPHPVSESFGVVEANGYFPRRGWIVDPAGGEAALPAAAVSGARLIAIRPSPLNHPKVFKLFQVGRLTEAVAAAKAGGCAI